MNLAERMARSHIIKELKVWVLFYGEANRDFKWSCDMVLCCAVSSVQSISHVQIFATPWTATSQTPRYMGFPKQEY